MILLATHQPELLLHWQGALATVRPLLSIDDLWWLPDLAARESPELLLIDEALPRFIGVDDIPALRHLLPKARIMVSLEQPDEEHELAYLRAGVSGSLHHAASTARIEKAVSGVLTGSRWIGSHLLPRVLGELEATGKVHLDKAAFGRLSQMESLSEREREVAERVAQGLSNKEIARQLDIAERTVKAHLTTIFQKTGTRDRLRLAMAVQNSPPSEEGQGS